MTQEEAKHTSTHAVNGAGSGYNGALEAALPTVEEAVRLAKLGYPVVQVYEVRDGRCSCPQPETCRSPGKHPIGGDKRMSRDETEIRRWWYNRPDANLGINLLHAGIVDVSTDSPDSLLDFQRRGLTETGSWHSGGGPDNRHHVYRQPAGGPVVRECKSDDYDLMSWGIAVLPPSVSAKGAYGWLNRITVPPAKLPYPPAWVTEKMAEQAEHNQAAATEIEIDFDGPPVRLSGEALERWRGERVRYTPDVEVDHSQSLLDIANDLARAGATEPTIYHAIIDRDETFGWLKYSGRATDKQVRLIAKSAVERYGPKAVAGSALRLLTATELVSRPDPPMLVADFLPSDATATIYAKYGSYKSFAALLLSACTVLGRPFLGRDIRNPGPVVYIVAEGTGGFKIRVEAVCKYLGVTLEQLDRAGIRFLSHSAALSNPGVVESLLTAITDQQLGRSPVLIVPDTVARTFGPGNENQQQDADRYLIGLDRLRTACDGATVLGLHHPNRDGEMRGSTALPGGFNTAIEMVKEKTGLVRFRCEKQKDGAEFEDFYAKTRIIDLDPPLPAGALRAIPERSSLVLELAEAPTRGVEGVPTVNSERALLATVTEIFPDETVARSRLLKASTIPETTFERALKALVTGGLLARETKGYRLTDAGREAGTPGTPMAPP